jgi:hypothetical protein
MSNTIEHAAVPGWGIDRTPDHRPGEPREAAPHPVGGAHWSAPARQVSAVPVLKRADLAELTPVFSTAAPPHGLSGELRRLAYAYPDQDDKHWVLLLLADRVDVIESDVGGFLRRAWPALALAAALGVGIRALRPRRRRRLFG